MADREVVISPAAQVRLAAAADFVGRHATGTAPLFVIAASRGAADELVARVALERGGLAGVRRASLGEIVTKLALPALADQGLLPTPALGEEAVAARATFESVSHGELRYFAPVAEMPGFPRALGRTLAEVRLAGLAPGDLHGDEALDDLARLLERANAERRKAGAVDYAALLAEAAETVLAGGSPLEGANVLLLDVPVIGAGDARVMRAIATRSGHLLATIPSGDQRAAEAWRAMDVTVRSDDDRSASARHTGPRPPARALDRLQHFLFATETPPSGDADDSVVILSAPGEGREAVEVARRVVHEAARGVPFDEMAILLRAPQTYLSLFEHALERAGVPAWFHRGTRRPDPAGRAFLALLTCAAEQLSARRFAEYVSLGQVPSVRDEGVAAPPEPPGQPWLPALDETVHAVLPERDRPEEVQPEAERAEQATRGENAHEVAGTLRAPWRWEELIVEAAVIGGIDRWRRRLEGLERDYAARLREVESDDPQSARARALRRDTEQLRALQAFAMPVLSTMAAWPAEQTWGAWLNALTALVPLVLSKPGRVLRVLQELGPLAAVGPVGLREVREVLSPRLSLLTHEPPRRRHGRLFVGTPHAARGRCFRVVFVPGLAERVFPQRLREDALLLDERREDLDAALPRQANRAADERQHLLLAAGAARDRLYISYPRLELSESRPRVPSFYVLDVVRAIQGVIPSAAAVAERADREGGARLAWPAPSNAADAIDTFEHDLSTIGGLLASRDAEGVKGRARYLYELSPELQRSLTARWLRWHRRQWEPADGLIRSTPATAPALARQRLGARPYSLTALQRFASCPYQFLLSAIYRLAPLEEPAPLQRLDPLTRGDLFHRIQASALRRLQAEHLLPLTPENLSLAQKLLEWSVTEVERTAFDDLAPAIERVWRDELAAISRDLKIWLEGLADEGAEWTPERFEFAFGLEGRGGHDPLSSTQPARVEDRFILRGSIDMVERHRQTGLLRVTDHKTGRNRTQASTTIVAGGRVLQPVLYGLALEALAPSDRVYSGRLSFCTAAGGFTTHEIPLLESARQTALQVLEIIDRSVEEGLLAARPEREACGYCDFQPICGRDEERRTRKKDVTRFESLAALRDLP